MGFFPSISNLAEKLVQTVTGSEALGDIAGLGAAYLTGDVKGLVSQSIDLADNVVKGGKKLLKGIGKAVTDSIAEFSNPGGVKKPNVGQCKCPGYGNGSGSIKPPSGNLANADIDSILNNPGLSLESKIMLILLKLQGEKRKEMKDRLDKSVQARQGGEGATVEVATGGGKTTKVDAQAAQQLLQQSANELNELTQLTTNMMKLFHDMKMATIQNIR